MKEPLPGRRPIEAIWYTGRMMGQTVAHNICGKQVSYDPGIWFNSAKFLDIEYQVYGTALANPPEEHKQLYWEHPLGKKSVRIIYHAETEEIIGFNLMGIRFRHEVCEKWLKEKTPVTEVLSNLSLANFDPEFYEEHEDDILLTFSKVLGKPLQNKAKRSWNSAFSFLKA